MKTTRSYTMTTRADAVEATRIAILDALVELVGERLFAEIGLEDVASRAGVSVQTVLRRFGSRAGLFDAGMEHGQATVAEERRTPVGDVSAAVQVLVDHYERRGRTSLMMLAQEDGEPIAAQVTARGRALHRTWVSDAFAPFLPGEAAEREAAVDLLVVACDVYTWKLLRLDRGLGRAQAQRRMERLVRAVLTSLGNPPEE